MRAGQVGILVSLLLSFLLVVNNVTKPIFRVISDLSGSAEPRTAMTGSTQSSSTPSDDFIVIQINVSSS